MLENSLEVKSDFKGHLFLSSKLWLREKLSEMLPHILIISVAFHWVCLLHWFFVCKNLVYGQFEGIVYHPRDQVFQKRTTAFQTWVFINFDQPSFELRVDNEIHAKQLITEPASVLVYLLFYRAKHHMSRLFHFIPYFLGLFSPNVFFQLFERKLIAVLEKPIVGRILLDGIVC